MSATNIRPLHAGRRLRQPATRGSGHVTTVKVITNSQVVGDELFAAVAFLSDALGLPALNPDADRTAKAIDLNALRRAAACAA